LLTQPLIRAVLAWRWSGKGSSNGGTQQGQTKKPGNARLFYVRL